MTREQFSRVMAYLSAGCGKEIRDETMIVYFDLLGDLPEAVLQAAAKRALLENHYPVLPTAGVLRKLAIEAMRGKENLPTAGEAWGMALRAASGNVLHEQEILARLHPLVAQAVRCFGFRTLCDATETEFLGAQFRKVYETLLERDQRQGLLTADLRQALEQIGSMPNVGPQRSEAEQKRQLRLLDEAGT